jgi:hypothetical protein
MMQGACRFRSRGLRTQRAANQRSGENSQTPSGKGSDAWPERLDSRCTWKLDPQAIRHMTRVYLDRCTAGGVRFPGQEDVCSAMCFCVRLRSALHTRFLGLLNIRFLVSFRLEQRMVLRNGDPGSPSVHLARAPLAGFDFCHGTLS